MRTQKWLMWMAALCMAGAGLVQAAGENTKVLADFNTPAPNNVNGNFGSFTPDPGEQVYTCSESIDDANKQGATGSSLHLDYNVDNGGAFNGFWMKLGPADATLDGSAYTKLTFWIKGDAKKGIPNKVKVELKSGAKFSGYYVGEISGDWKKIEIPLDVYAKKGVDLTKLSEITIVFEQRFASPGTVGAINIDDVLLEK